MCFALLGEDLKSSKGEPLSIILFSPLIYGHGTLKLGIVQMGL